MKKLIYVFAILVASVSFVSCGGSEEDFVLECPVENWEGTYSGDCAGNPVELSINSNSVTVSFDNTTDTTSLEFSQDGCAATFNSAIFGEFSLVLDESTLTVEVSNSTSGQFDDCGNFITLEKLPPFEENIIGSWEDELGDIYVFFVDGNGKRTSNRSSQFFTYEVSNDMLILADSFTNTNPITYTIVSYDFDEIKLTNSGSLITFTRI